MKESFEPGRSFEETYPKFPFSPLVRLSIDFARWIKGIRYNQAGRHQPGAPRRQAAITKGIMQLLGLFGGARSAGDT